MLKLLWDGGDCYHPTTGLMIKAGECEYPEEHAEALLALGLKPSESLAPIPRKRRMGGEEVEGHGAS
jgi:hypothetical protein